jgi:hypothetical protein
MRLGMHVSSIRRNIEPQLETRRDARGRVVFRESDIERVRRRRLETHDREAELFAFLREGGDPVDLVALHGLSSDEAQGLMERFAALHGCALLSGDALDDIRRALRLAPDAPLDPETIAMRIRTMEAELINRFERTLEDRAQRLANSHHRVLIERIRASVALQKESKK